MSDEMIVNKLNELQKIIKKVEKNKLKINKTLDNPKKAVKISPEAHNKIKVVQKEIIELKSNLRESRKNSSQKASFSQGSDGLNSQVTETQKIIDIMTRAFEKQNNILKIIKNKKIREQLN